MSIARNRSALPFVLLIAGAAVLFLAGLGRLPLFGRDEALYAEAAREMLATGDWITPRVNGGPFLEKPPLYYWLAVGSYHGFGVSPFSARLPAALMAILTMALTAQIGARVWGARAGLLAGLALATSLQIAMIGRMGIMDAPLTCLTALTLLAYERWRSRGGPLPAIGFAFSWGLALLLKGAAGLIPGGVAVVDQLVCWAVRSRSNRIALGHRLATCAHRRAAAVAGGLLAPVVLVAVVAPWFLAMSARHGETFGSTFFLQEHLKRMFHPMQGHGGPFWIYLPLIAVSFFPWVMFLPAAFALLLRGKNETQAFWCRLSMIWIFFVLLLFSAIKTKLPGYVTPLFPAMALLVGAELDRGGQRRSWAAVMMGSLVLAGLVLLLPTAAQRLGERVGASQEARLLATPAAAWAVGYTVIAFGAGLRLSGRFGAQVGNLRPSLGLLTIGQLITVAALLFGVLPVVSPYLGGGSAHLAQLAQRELPERQLVLYETHPETVNFVLHRTVLTFGRRQQAELRERLGAAPTALIAPARETAFWQRLPARRIWRLGDRVLLDIPKLSQEDNR